MDRMRAGMRQRLAQRQGEPAVDPAAEDSEDASGSGSDEDVSGCGGWGRLGLGLGAGGNRALSTSNIATHAALARPACHRGMLYELPRTLPSILSRQLRAPPPSYRTIVPTGWMPDRQQPLPHVTAVAPPFLPPPPQPDAPMDRRAARRAARREAAAADRAAADAKMNKRSAYEERRAKREAEREAQEAAQVGGWCSDVRVGGRPLARPHRTRDKRPGTRYGDEGGIGKHAC